MLILSRRKKKITIRMADDVSRQTKLDGEALQEKCGKRWKNGLNEFMAYVSGQRVSSCGDWPS